MNTPLWIGDTLFQLPSIARRIEAEAWCDAHSVEPAKFLDHFPDATLTHARLSSRARPLY